MKRRRDRGQALVELAIVAPVFFMMLFGIVDFGRVIWATNALTNAANEGARFAIVHGGSPSTPCPVGPSSRPDIPAASSSCPYPSPSKQSIVDTATRYAIAGGPSVMVTVCYGVGCTGNTDATGGTNARGTPVTVVASSNLSLFTPSLLGLRTFAVSGSSTMLVNH